jgi:hypothetical protein
MSEIAWPLDVPAVDAGVGEGLRGRVQVLVPGRTTACLECGWGKADYDKLAAEYSCKPGEPAAGPSTISPAFAGGVVGGLIAAEAVKILAGPRPEESSEIAFDLFHRRFLVSRLRRNPGCRFDHALLERLMLGQPFNAATIGDLLEVVERFSATPTTLEFRARAVRSRLHGGAVPRRSSCGLAAANRSRAGFDRRRHCAGVTGGAPCLWFFVSPTRKRGTVQR